MLQPYSENFRKIRVNDDDGTYAADFPLAKLYSNAGDSGGSATSYIGIAAEASAIDGDNHGVGVLASATADGDKFGFGISSTALVKATGDTGDARAIQANAVATHAGGANYGIYSRAANGATNYSFYGKEGDIYNEGRTLGMQGTDIASGTNISLPSDGNVFELTGTTKVDLISNLGWNNGSEITLIANESVVIDHGTATSTTNITIKLLAACDYSMTAGDTLKLVLSTTTADGQAWREVSRSVN